MSVVKYANDAPVDVQVIARDENSNPVTNAALQITWQRQLDKQYWTGTGSVFQVAPFQIAMNEISEVNSPGLWEFLFASLGLPADSYFGVITDTSGNAVNMPQHFTAIIGDEIVDLIELAAAGAVGRAEYSPTTSVLTLYKWDDPNTIIFQFNIKDAAGNPAANSAFFRKLPQ